MKVIIIEDNLDRYSSTLARLFDSFDVSQIFYVNFEEKVLKGMSIWHVSIHEINKKLNTGISTINLLPKKFFSKYKISDHDLFVLKMMLNEENYLIIDVGVKNE